MRSAEGADGQRGHHRSGRVRAAVERALEAFGRVDSLVKTRSPRAMAAHRGCGRGALLARAVQGHVMGTLQVSQACGCHEGAPQGSDRDESAAWQRAAGPEIWRLTARRKQRCCFRPRRWPRSRPHGIRVNSVVAGSHRWTSLRCSSDGGAASGGHGGASARRARRPGT